MDGIVLNFRDSRVLLSRLYVCNQERSFILPVRGWTRRNKVTQNCTSDWGTLWNGRETGELWLLSNYRRKRKLQPSDLYKNVTKNNIKTDPQLCFHAMMALNENNNLLLSWSWKENIKEGTPWKLNTTAAAIKRNSKSWGTHSGGGEAHSGAGTQNSLRREAYVNKGYTNLWNIKNKNTKIQVLTSGWSGNKDVRQSVEEFCISLQVWCEHKNRLGTLSQVFCETYPLGWKLFFRKTIEIVFWKMLKTVVSTQKLT